MLNKVGNSSILGDCCKRIPCSHPACTTQQDTFSKGAGDVAQWEEEKEKRRERERERDRKKKKKKDTQR